MSSYLDYLQKCSIRVYLQDYYNISINIFLLRVFYSELRLFIAPIIGYFAFKLDAPLESFVETSMFSSSEYCTWIRRAGLSKLLPLYPELLLNTFIGSIFEFRLSFWELSDAVASEFLGSMPSISDATGYPYACDFSSTCPVGGCWFNIKSWTPIDPVVSSVSAPLSSSCSVDDSWDLVCPILHKWLSLREIHTQRRLEQTRIKTARPSARINKNVSAVYCPEVQGWNI